MQVFHPTTERQIASRDVLLQEALRPRAAAFPIASEYPLVLAPELARRSFCVGSREADEVYAHANFFVRSLTGTSKVVRIGLVGNVASLPEHRGRGHVRLVIAEIAKRAKADGLAALLLWSDLEEFYQKLGFRSFGRELRLTVDGRKLTRGAPALGCELVHPEEVTAQLVRDCLELRTAAGVTIERSVEEFQRLLTIPCTDLFVAQVDRDGRPMVCAYAIVGKGYDMQGVVHEWGAADGQALKGVLACATRTLELPEVLILAPPDTPNGLLDAIKSETRSAEEHPMAWMLPLASGSRETEAALERLFIWGLDSI